MMDDDVSPPSLSRRHLFKSLTLIPLAATGLGACDSGSKAQTSAQPREERAPYQPTFFNALEWAFLHAACDRLIPADELGPGALEAGVPEFIDRHMHTAYANGDIWYMQGPFLDAPREFGYQGKLSVREQLRLGMRAVDLHCRQHFDDQTFAQLTHADQESILKNLEKGTIQFEELHSPDFFGQLLAETRMGFFCDPRHGGNRDMVGWKLIGYPGMRADYLYWVEVRDKPYSLPPVDLAGRRG